MIEIKKKLAKNPHLIENILTKYNFDNIKSSYGEVRCAVEEGGNATSVRIKLNDNLTTTDFARDIYGDLFSYIMKVRDVEFSHVLKTVKEELGISKVNFTKPAPIFGGFYSNVRVRHTGSHVVNTFDEDIMKDYIGNYNLKFLRDGIGFATQKKFKIGLDPISCRITVPWYNSEGELVGIEGRYNGDYEKDGVGKWMPVGKPFSKTNFLYGYYENYKDLQGCEEVYIGESSKFVMQLDEMLIHTGVALGGKSIHPQQLKQLSWLNPERIIFCFDEGLEEEMIIAQTEKALNLLRFTNIKIGYVIDRENEMIREGSKASPTDAGRDTFEELVKNYVEWVN